MRNVQLNWDSIKTGRNYYYEFLISITVCGLVFNLRWLWNYAWTVGTYVLVKAAWIHRGIDASEEISRKVARPAFVLYVLYINLICSAAVNNF